MANPTVLPKNIPAPAAQKARPLQAFGQRYQNVIYPVLAGLLIVLAAGLVYLLLANTFKSIFTCKHLISEPLGTSILCEGVEFPHFTFLGINVGPYTIIPELKVIDKPLDGVRRFVVWNIVLAFGVVSLVLAFVAIKIKDFVRTVLTPDGRKKILTNLSIFLFIFALFCGLFYFGYIVR